MASVGLMAQMLLTIMFKQREISLEQLFLLEKLESLEEL